ncbi:beta-ketoacyl-[acyl-carrier-protein] synthase family protein [Alkaliphilus peptidifermentans]|uniref:Nodulation protein E n=1 Tax=Alkaliphilus peptidifermentans DSM 18978 TaxID=1120976 RepID=A0A1G5I9D5_9FIRM|nr:beta-ketoacyl-[acyl-carrier-protein] synthase family protein [Alkaliphilus peptidifermentans]SCY72663.1 3-oxoacyl-[acyl-carrier-protein] synthase II [Alkaliphilus peptidifermentans DSM 18978]
MRRVVITGIAPVTALGIGEEFFESIFENKRVIQPIPEVYQKNYEFKSKHYVPAPEINLKEFGFSRTLDKMMSNASKIMVLAVYLALKDAKISLMEKDKRYYSHLLEESAIIIGTGFTSIEVAFNSFKGHLGNIDNEKYNRLTIPMIMTNAPASWISIIFGVMGDNFTLNTACASGTYAIGEAYKRIKSGESNLVISGGVECLVDETGATMRGFDILDTLNKDNDGYGKPFSRSRSGFLYNDGAGCALILEEYQHAKNRGAEIYCEILNYEKNSDSYSIVQMNKDGNSIEELIRKLIGEEKIDYINTHGTGTDLNDAVEADVIRRIFGNKDTQPYINSSKGIIGHSLGASGALEAAITAYSIKHGKIHGNFVEDIMDNLNASYENLSTPINRAISLSYGFGGHNGGLMFGGNKP